MCDLPTISVIVPVYKVEKYIHRCIDSILAQTFADFELLLVDDGSPDNCGAICEEYAAKDSRVRVLHQENKGQAAARNAAVTRAQGEYACFVDADDAVHPRMIEILYGAMKSTGSCISVCSALERETLEDSFLADNGIPQFERYELNEDVLLTLYDQPYFCWVVWGKLMPMRLAQRIPFTAGRIYEDNAVVIKWLYEAKTIAVTDAQLYFYQVNKNGTTKGQRSEKWVRDSIWATTEQLDFFAKKKMNKLFEKFITPFLWTLLRHYNEAKESTPDLAAELKRIGRKWWLKGGRKATLTSNEWWYISGTFYPRCTYILEGIKGHLKWRGKP